MQYGRAFNIGIYASLLCHYKFVYSFKCVRQVILKLQESQLLSDDKLTQYFIKYVQSSNKQHNTVV